MTLYYQDDNCTIYHGDCREVLRGLPPGDAVITDPPYGETSLEWDSWVDGWPALISAPVLWCFGSMRMFLDRHADFAGWRFGQDVVWEKHNGSGFHADRFKRVHEHAVQWYRGTWDKLYRDVPTTADATPRVVRRKERPTHMGEIEDSTYVSHDGGPRLTRSVIYARSCHGYAVHPTQKPEAIIMPLLTYSVPSGGLVVDPFMGSGSTLCVAKVAGRRAVGIEVSERYCELAALRLSQEVLDLGGAA